MLKKNEKKSFIVILLYKKTFSSFPKAVMFAKQVKVILEEKRLEMTELRTQKFNLPLRYRC